MVVQVVWKRFLIGIVFCFVVSPFSDGSAQSFFQLGKEKSRPVLQDSKPLSNSAVQILVRNDTVWIGGGKGLDMTSDAGLSWKHFGQDTPFAAENIAAFGGSGSTLCASLAGSVEMDDGSSLPEGLGLAISTDNGVSWKKRDQPKESEGDTTFIVQYGSNSLKALAVTTAINNIAYDVAVTSNAIWTANFAGGLRKSTDNGATFQLIVLPPDFLDSIKTSDSLGFELSPVDRPDFWNLSGTTLGMRGNLNHRVFSVLALDDSNIWVGTAGGINATTDGGNSWRKFTYANQSNAISGNFVVALGHNVIHGVDYIWAATINALEPQEYRAISFTTNRGTTWETALRDEFTHNFGFKDSIAYAATNSGVFRSDDGGRTWGQFSNFIDYKSRQRSTAENCYAITSQGETIWVANADGLMTTTDGTSSSFGEKWKLFRAYQSTVTTSDVYVYPNPFAPDDEVSRVHFKTDVSGSVTIKVFDFAFFPVRTVLQNAARPANVEQDEIWDGKDDSGKQVANGVYYVQVTIGNAQASWGKVIVLQ